MQPGVPAMSPDILVGMSKPIRERGEDIEGVGEDGQRHVLREAFGQGEDGGAGIEEDGLVGLDAAGGQFGNGLLLGTHHRLAFHEGEIRADALEFTGSAVDALELAALLQELEVLAHGFVGDSKLLGGFGGPKGTGLPEEFEDLSLTLNG